MKINKKNLSAFIDIIMYKNTTMMIYAKSNESKYIYKILLFKKKLSQLIKENLKR